jgi:urea carboxylase
MSFSKVLIANRGVIACRIQRTLRRLGIASVAVYSDADRNAKHVLEADEAYRLGPAPVAESYLLADRILEIALQTGAQAIHPGYGFLSENADFSEACEKAGIAFMGPTAHQMREFGLKHRARELAQKAGVPLLPGTPLLPDLETAIRSAVEVGYPVMLKSTAGGGGIGMKLCANETELREAYESVKRLSEKNFKEGGLYLEKFVARARHVEVQLFGDGKEEVLALGERDCSLQRRNQKVVEETPAPDLPDAVRQKLLADAVRLGKSVGYRSAGTAEFIYDAETHQYYFLEVNTRLQVEHGVTEEVTGIDLVEWMIKLASGDLPPLGSLQPVSRGHSIQVRLYAEDPSKNFRPCCGPIAHADFSKNARMETWIETGAEITPHYDPMIAKIIVLGKTREEAIEKMQTALGETRIQGIACNLDYLKKITALPEFKSGRMSTRTLSDFSYASPAIEVLLPGAHTTIQDWPGRVGYWNIGVPPSGPMDPLAFRWANRIVGNPEGKAGLEMTMTGPTLKFGVEAWIAVTGAPTKVTLDGKPIAMWKTQRIPAGSTLSIGVSSGAGLRTYLAVRGGFDLVDYLGSQSTFTLGKFGGAAGRHLMAGDSLPIFEKPTLPESPLESGISTDLIPAYEKSWEIGVTYGPHGAPDFFTPDDIEMIYGTEWKVHYNSNRTGVRLIGPRPRWERTDGGEAGLHPSNLHDNAYAIGSIDFTGDMPILLGPDGPSLGGFVCPGVIVQSELWKLGQLKAGDGVRFRIVSAEAADASAGEQSEMLQRRSASDASLPAPLNPDLSLENADEKWRGTGSVPQKTGKAVGHCPSSSNARSGLNWITSPASIPSTAIMHELPAKGERPRVVYRYSGDANLLVEYGPLELDLNLRFRIHALMQWIEKARLPGLIDLTPGIRSIQIHFDPRKLSRKEWIRILDQAESELPPLDNLVIPSRTIHLPLSWDDPQTRLAIEKYQQSVWKEAPWCPSNIEFIRRINGLSSEEAVKEIVFNANYLVMGLGDVYLGAPVAVPLDPRHRLVTTKYNPARTWTPENAVGIGGAYLCIYGMEGPGGYQFVGRTIQMWNTHRQTREFPQRWLLRFFDRIQFYPVSAEELMKNREDFPQGRFHVKIEEEEFSLKAYHDFLHTIEKESRECKTRQQNSFDAERERWVSLPSWVSPEDDSESGAKVEVTIPEGCVEIPSPLTGSIWKLEVKEGDRVKAGDLLVILEAMKMELAVTAPESGIVEKIFIAPGKQVSAGQTLFHFRTQS